MANLRVDKIASTETFERTGSVQFDGSTTSIRAGWVDDYNYLHHGTEDWTAECWVYPQVVNSRQTIFSTGGNSSSHGFCVRIMEQGISGSSNGYYVSAQMSRGAGGNYIYWSSDPKKLEADTWYHIAVVFRSSNKSLEIYVDGELTNGKGDTGYVEGTFTTYSSSNAHSGLMLGHEPYGSSLKLTGFISNFRIVQGKLVYTKNFKVPMKELEVIPGTTLLCCQSKTSAAAAKISPFISGVNDGTIWSDSLDVTNGGRLRHTDYGDGSIHDAAKVFDARDDTDAEGPNGTNNNIIFDFETLLGKKIPVSSSIKIKIGGSDGRTLKVNGTTIATNAGPTESVITNQSTLNKVEVVAESSARSGRLAYIKVDDVSLTLPVLPFGKVVHSELSPGLLTDKVIDGGNSAIKGSVEFDGEYDGLVLSKSTDFQFGTGDFTIEGWFNVSDTGAIRTLFDSRNSDTTTNGLFVGINSDDNLYTYGFPGGTGVANYGIPKHGEWHHFAVVRNGSNGYVFLNGVKVSGSIDTSSSNYTHQGATVGQPSTAFAETLYRYKGFISNLRVVKGTGLYTHDFIPSTRELKKIPGTVLLCCQDPDNPLTEATGKTITPYGDLGDGSLGGELVTNNSVWTLTKGGGGATDWTVSNNGRSLAGTTVSGGYIRATYTLPKGDYLVSLRWTGGNFAVQSSAGYITATDGTDTEFGSSEDGAYSFYMSDTTSVVITGTSWSTAYTVDDISIKRIYRNNGESNFTPQVGDDRKVTFEGVTKVNSDAYFYLPTGDTASRYLNVASQASSAARGLRAGGQTPSVTNAIDFTTIPTRGNSLRFGDLTIAKFGAGGIGSPTRGLFCAGGTPTRQSAIDYITIASEGDAQDFGDLFGSARTIAGSSGGNSVRGLTFGGATASSTDNTICYVTIATTSDGQDFGDCTKQNGCAVVCSPTRAVSAGGDTAANGSHINTIEFVTIQTMGTATDFGNLLSAGTGRGVSSATRGVFSTEAPSAAQTLTFLTMATEGNVVTFGDLISNNQSGGCAAYSSLTRGIFAGIRTPSVTNVCEFINIASTGDATDFGDLIATTMNGGGLSNGHGGLG